MGTDGSLLSQKWLIFTDLGFDKMLALSNKKTPLSLFLAFLAVMLDFHSFVQILFERSLFH